MKIQINEKGTRGYYNEIAYIKLNYSKVLDNPVRPANTITGYVSLRVIGFLLVVVAGIYLYLTTKDVIYAAISVGTVIAEIAIILSLVNGIKKMNSLMAEDGPRVIEVDEEGIRCIQGDKTTELKWDDISCIAINRHSISVLPKETRMYGIYADLRYRKELEQAIRAAGRFYMIEDNVSKE